MEAKLLDRGKEVLTGIARKRRMSARQRKPASTSNRDVPHQKARPAAMAAVRKAAAATAHELVHEQSIEGLRTIDALLSKKIIQIEGRMVIDGPLHGTCYACYCEHVVEEGATRSIRRPCTAHVHGSQRKVSFARALILHHDVIFFLVAGLRTEGEICGHIPGMDIVQLKGEQLRPMLACASRVGRTPNPAGAARQLEGPALAGWLLRYLARGEVRILSYARIAYKTCKGVPL